MANLELVLRQRMDRFLTRIRNLVRRVSIADSADASAWKLGGVSDGSNTEAHTAEVFSGIGIYARPANASAEAILVSVGGQSNNPAIVGVRDEAMRASIEKALGGVAAGETVVFNPTSVVYLRGNGLIEIRSKDGVAGFLSTHEDLQQLKQAFDSWIVVPNDGGGALYTLLQTLIGTGWPHGTSKLKAE